MTLQPKCNCVKNNFSTNKKKNFYLISQKYYKFNKINQRISDYNQLTIQNFNNKRNDLFYFKIKKKNKNFIFSIIKSNLINLFLLNFIFLNYINYGVNCFDESLNKLNDIKKLNSTLTAISKLTPKNEVINFYLLTINFFAFFF